MKPTLTDKKMTCDKCGQECQVYETKGAVLENLLYYSQCPECRRVSISEDGLHWEPLMDVNNQEAQNEG